jgi:hypothetical protein
MKVRFIILGVLFLTIGFASRAHFMSIQTKAVPISRVLANLEARLVRDSKNVETLYQLGRIHSMAFSTNLTTIDMTTNSHSGVNEPFFGYLDIGKPYRVTRYTNAQAQAAARQHLTNAITYYRQAAELVLKGTNANDKWITLPIYLGLAWCIDQDGRREDAIKAYRKALQLAWNIEVEPTPTVKEQLNWSWDQIRAKKSPFSKPPAHTSIGLFSFSDEIIRNLLPLLDPKKDAKEIAQLEKDKKTIASMGRAITPILVPLEPNANFADLVNPAANVAFDLDGSALPRRWGWITPKAAWLVYDHDGSGRITSGLQMFGSVTFWIFWRDGYDALSSLDDNGDGRLSGDELKGISLWQDLNGNGVADPGEVRPITDYGVVAIECGCQPGADGMPFNPRGIIFRDGTSRPTYDWLVPSAPIAPIEQP